MVPAVIGSAPTIARATSVRPAPIRPAKPRISPSSNSKLTSLSRCLVDNSLTDRITGRSLRTFSGRASEVISRPTMRAMTSFIVVVCGVQGVDVATVPDHRDPVRDGLELVHLVRDVDDAGLRRDVPADQLVQRGHLGVVERRGGLVHDQHPAVVGQRLGDLHHLLLGHRHGADGLPRVERQLQPVDQLGGLVGSGPDRSVKKPPLRGSRPMKMFWATVRSGIRLNS